MAPRALSRVARRYRLADRSLFVQRELCCVIHHSAIEITTFPNCWPDSRRSNA